MIWFAVFLQAAQTQDPNVQAVAKALADAEPKLHRCWEKAAADDNHVDGHIDLNVCIGKNGAPKKIIVAADSTGHPALTACASAVFQVATFAGFNDGDEIDVPVDFQAEDQFTIRSADVTPNDTPAETLRPLLTAKNVGSTALTMTLLTLKPGAAQPAHKLDVPVIYAVEKGDVTALGKAWKPGDRISVPAKTSFGLASALGAELLEVRGTQAMRDVSQMSAEPDHADPNARALFITDGAGALVMGRESFPIEVGMGVYVPPNTPHHLQGAINAWEFEAKP